MCEEQLAATRWLPGDPQVQETNTEITLIAQDRLLNTHMQNNCKNVHLLNNSLSNMYNNSTQVAVSPVLRATIPIFTVFTGLYVRTIECIYGFDLKKS